MDISTDGNTTRLSLLLGLVRNGEQHALGLVFEAAYSELCTLARSRLRRSGRSVGENLDTGALVHEVFLRLSRRHPLGAEHRADFFRYAARVMRSVIVDSVRERSALRRGGGTPHASLAAEPFHELSGEDDMLRVHEALDELAAREPQLFDVVQMRYFGGMTDAEIAEVLGVTDRTVRRHWERARALLFAALTV